MQDRRISRVWIPLAAVGLGVLVLTQSVNVTQNMYVSQYTIFATTDTRRLTVHVLVTSEAESSLTNSFTCVGGGEPVFGRGPRRIFWSLEGCVRKPLQDGTD